MRRLWVTLNKEKSRAGETSNASLDDAANTYVFAGSDKSDECDGDHGAYASTKIVEPVYVMADLKNDHVLENSLMNTSFWLPFERASDVGSPAGAPTVIRAGLHLEGNIRTSDDILLEGSVRGEVIANSITIAAGATLHGTVSAAVIVVDGTVDGVVHCIKLQVNATGSVSGEIHHNVLVVEAGAAIEGTVFRTERHSEKSATVTPVADLASKFAHALSAGAGHAVYSADA